MEKIKDKKNYLRTMVKIRASQQLSKNTFWQMDIRLRLAGITGFVR